MMGEHGVFCMDASMDFFARRSDGDKMGQELGANEDSICCGFGNRLLLSDFYVPTLLSSC